MIIERVRRSVPGSFAALALAAALLVTFAAPAGPDLKARLQGSLDALYAGAKFPGVTAAIVLPDGTALGLAAGFSDREARTPITTSDRLLMGSVGKTYVAAVALQLMGEGKIGLDDKVEKWLGGEAWYGRLPNGRDVTVRHLMTHTSGIVRYEFQERFTADLTRQPDKVWSPEDRLAYVFDLTPPFAAGQGWEYSDTNYIVLGLILEKAGGAPYYDLLKKRILEPLGLADTVPAVSRKVPGLVQGYAGPNNPFGGTDAMIKDGVFAVNPQLEWTGGGLACTTLDLARWAKLLYEGKAVGPDLVSKMIEAGVPAKLGRDAKYGLGVIIRPTPLGAAWGHSGFFPGYLTEMCYFPDHKLAVAVQFNTSVGRDIGRNPLGVLLELAGIAAAGVPAAK
jgi:D-alanyl-D-alanine carboxypeptidase